MEDVEHRFIGIQHDLQRIAYDTKEDAHEFLLSSQEDFEESLRFVEEISFYEIHVFTKKVLDFLAGNGYNIFSTQEERVLNILLIQDMNL